MTKRLLPTGACVEWFTRNGHSRSGVIAAIDGDIIRVTSVQGYRWDDRGSDGEKKERDEVFSIRAFPLTIVRSRQLRTRSRRR